MFQKKLRAYLKAGYPLLGVETHEEGRLVEDVVAALQEGGLTHEIFSWDQVSGVMEHTAVGATDDAITLLDKPKSLSDRIQLDDLAGTLKLLLNDSETPQILILKDFHPFLESPDIVRLLRTLVVHYKANHRTVLMVSPQLKVPLELNRDFTMMDYGLPTREEHKALLDGFVKTNINTEKGFENLVFHPEIFNQAAESLMGLTTNQAENAISLAVTRGGPPDALLGDDLVKALFREKVAQLRQGTLEYLDPSKQPSIGGLGPLREWARKRKYEFSEDARKEGLPYARGVLLTGVPGCGKTLMASEFARVFGMPLYRLDIGRLFASKVGETEALTREVIRQMDSLGAACILVDEMEKSLSRSATSGAGDSGTSSRMFATLLSWLNDKTCPVFLIGTSNNMDALPTELTRPGRFDATFFVDLPGQEERQDILMACVNGRRMFHSHQEIAESTEGCTGAELAQLVRNAELEFCMGGKQGTFDQVMLRLVEQVTPQFRSSEVVTKQRESALSKGWIMANEATVRVTKSQKKRSVSLN